MTKVVSQFLEIGTSDITFKGRDRELKWLAFSPYPLSFYLYSPFLRNCFLLLIQGKLVALKYEGHQLISFPRHLILNMLRIRHYKKTLAMYSYIWDSLYLDVRNSTLNFLIHELFGSFYTFVKSFIFSSGGFNTLYNLQYSRVFLDLYLENFKLYWTSKLDFIFLSPLIICSIRMSFNN